MGPVQISIILEILRLECIVDLLVVVKLGRRVMLFLLYLQSLKLFYLVLRLERLVDEFGRAVLLRHSIVMEQIALSKLKRMAICRPLR